MAIVQKKRGRPAKIKEIITPKGRRGRPKKSAEILDSRRTIRFTDLYKEKVDKVDEPKKKYNYIKKKDRMQMEDMLSPGVKQSIAECFEDLKIGEEEITRNLRIEEGNKASSRVDSINKRQNISMTSFQDGNKASPGRPLGSRNKSTLMLEAVGSENVVAVYKRLVELALAGDVTACKIILDRVYPVQKFRKISLEFEGSMDTIQDINALSKHVLKLAVDGEISFDEAEECGRVLEQRMKNITDTEMAAKIDRTCEMVERIKRGE